MQNTQNIKTTRPKQNMQNMQNVNPTLRKQRTVVNTWGPDSNCQAEKSDQQEEERWMPVDIKSPKDKE